MSKSKRQRREDIAWILHRHIALRKENHKLRKEIESLRDEIKTEPETEDDLFDLALALRGSL